MSFLKALAKEPDYRADLSTIPASAAGLANMASFVVMTFRSYWAALLPPEKMAEFSSSLEQFNGVSKEDKMKQLNEWFAELKEKNPSYNTAAWPSYDREKLSDCIGRNILAAMIVQDPEKQAMMGGKYNYSAEVREVCDKILNAKE